MPQSVAIVGVGATTGPTRAESLEALIFSTASAALEDAGIAIDQVDAVVTACADQVDGRAISSMVNSGPAGGHLRDEVNLASSGAHALVQGYLTVASGRFSTVLVSSWGKASEGSVTTVERLSTDPYFDRDLPLTELSAMGMQAEAFRAQVPRAAEAAQAVVEKSRKAGGDSGERTVGDSPVVAAPLRAAEVAPYIDGAFSLVLSGNGDPHSNVFIRGAGWASDRYRLPDRDLVRLPHLRTASRRAYAAAQIDGPGDVDFAELHDYSADAELLACSAVGMGDPAAVVELVLSGDTGAGGSTPVNPSGGSLRGEVPFANGLQKAVEAVRRLRSPDDGHGAALVQMAAGFAGQFQTVVVMGRNGRGA